MEDARKVASLAIDQGKEQERGYSGSTKRQKETPLCCIDGHLSSQKNAELGPIFRNFMVES